MKKVLFAALALAVAMTGFAQRPVAKNEAKNLSVTVQKPSDLRQIDGSAAQGMQFNMPEHMVKASRSLDDFSEYQTMTTYYDLQSNSAIGNRVAVWPDGTAAVTATWDYSGNVSFPDRGTGYNYYDGNDFGDEPVVRQEPMKSGWPSIATCGDGELLASHATGVNLYYRPTKGEGDWELIFNWGNDFGAPTWPRVICSGPNDEYVHLGLARDELTELHADYRREIRAYGSRGDRHVRSDEAYRLIADARAVAESARHGGGEEHEGRGLHAVGDRNAYRRAYDVAVLGDADYRL